MYLDGFLSIQVMDPAIRAKVQKALRGKRPLILEYSCQIGNRSEALKIEHQVKKLSKIKKEQLITGGVRSRLPSANKGTA